MMSFERFTRLVHQMHTAHWREATQQLSSFGKWACAVQEFLEENKKVIEELRHDENPRFQKLGGLLHMLWVGTTLTD